MKKNKQAIIDMMKLDEKLGLYDDTEINRIELVCKDCSDSLENCICIKSTVDFPKQEGYICPHTKVQCDDECCVSAEDCHIKSSIGILSEPKQRLEKYSERFDNKDNEIGNPETWGKRVLTEEDIFNQIDIDAVTDYIGKETSKQETLEEAAERITTTKFSPVTNKFTKINIFIEGAKWQQEQIGKSEFLQKLRATLSDAEARRLIFETFKNK